jgi:hypothetical protein
MRRHDSAAESGIVKRSNWSERSIGAKVAFVAILTTNRATAEHSLDLPYYSHGGWARLEHRVTVTESLTPVPTVSMRVRKER